MKEKLYTIPLNDAFGADDECPFCYIERMLEQQAIAFILGSAYMEEDIREETDKTGFCRHHYKMMFDYGNQLGNAMMLDTYMKRLNKDLEQMLEQLTPEKSSVFNKLRKSSAADEKPAFTKWADKEVDSCYVCEHVKKSYPRYLDTFFEMLKKDPDFVKTVEHSKGFCMPHFSEITAQLPAKLNTKQQDQVYPVLKKVMLENMKRVHEDIQWFVQKYDYRNHDADWKNSKDAVQRGIQKAGSGYPSDPVFMSDR